ncbi:MAG: hypothetical protein ACJAU2_001100 [Maribacter sp.]|jgi:hypothetical protein
MNKIQIKLRLLTLCVFLSLTCFGQKDSKSKKLGKVSKLFATQTMLPVELSYSNRDLKKHTNYSTYLDTDLTYSDVADTKTTLPVRIRARGNFRRKNCYFTPVKFRIKKEDAKGTLFKGNKELKLVLPCLKETNANDNVIKELLAYKLFEVVSEYHFKTRLLDLSLNEARGKKIENHNVKAFFIEDIDELEDRFGGKKLKRNVHPLQQDSLHSIRNAFFQYMIGNTDFSTGYQHNQKILFVNGSSIPIPYDFDMSGLCNVSYSIVSKIEGKELPLESVTVRLYRGFNRSDATISIIKDEFLENRIKMIAIVDGHEDYFDNPKEFAKCKEYLLEFFSILESPTKFKTEILDTRRVK